MGNEGIIKKSSVKYIVVEKTMERDNRLFYFVILFIASIPLLTLISLMTCVLLK